MIDVPPDTKWDRTLSKIKKINPIVQAAIIAGIFSLAGTWLGIQLQSSGNQARIDDLEKQVNEQKTTIIDKTTEIQRLETLLTPFRTIALQKYTDPEPEALRKLAYRIKELESSVAPRHLSDKQEKALLESLSGQQKGEITVVSRMMDGEAKDYALQLANTIADSGWKVGINFMLADDIIGLGVTSYKYDSRLPNHNYLLSTLNNAGIPCNDIVIKDNSVPLGEKAALLLVVGRKK